MRDGYQRMITRVFACWLTVLLMGGTWALAGTGSPMVLRLTFVPGSELDYSASLEKIASLAHEQGILSLDALAFYPANLDEETAQRHRDFLDKQLDYIQHVGRLYHLQIRRSLQCHAAADYDRIVLNLSGDKHEGI